MPSRSTLDEPRRSSYIPNPNDVQYCVDAKTRRSRLLKRIRGIVRKSLQLARMAEGDLEIMLVASCRDPFRPSFGYSCFASDEPDVQKALTRAARRVRVDLRRPEDERGFEYFDLERNIKRIVDNIHTFTQKASFPHDSDDEREWREIRKADAVVEISESEAECADDAPQWEVWDSSDDEGVNVMGEPVYFNSSRLADPFDSSESSSSAEDSSTIATSSSYEWRNAPALTPTPEPTPERDCEYFSEPELTLDDEPRSTLLHSATSNGSAQDSPSPSPSPEADPDPPPSPQRLQRTMSETLEILRAPRPSRPPRAYRDDLALVHRLIEFFGRG